MKKNSKQNTQVIILLKTKYNNKLQVLWDKGIIDFVSRGNYKKSNMETFKIEVKETLSRIIEIEACSENEAFSKIQDLYNKEEIVLDADDYVGTEFLISE